MSREEDAGSDLFAPESVVLSAHTTTRVPLGFAAAFSKRFWAKLEDRSSMAKRGLHVLAGVIESEYRGEWCVVLCNFSDVDYIIKAGDRICQVVFKERVKGVFLEVEDLCETVRGEGGFGSSGV
jgi:dUTP pyrophosphatase